MATPGTQDMKMDPATLYREDIYTDRRMGTIRVMTPVTADGATDASRDVIFVGEAQVFGCSDIGLIRLGKVKDQSRGRRRA